ncbi:hypothetical protein R3P38DRAFT_3344366 [Favolaschia claudopus]|uniref:Zn(2)-C6 fungal-type domain-containing protein n=1 Tax=Favolaschia claudopus TaxID=2862362 RepID=A0AAW0DMR0_9AGAR
MQAKGHTASRLDDAALSMPQAEPKENTVIAFWQRIASVSTRTRREDGKWIGGEEVRRWNAANTKGCDRCTKGKVKRHCVIEEYQAACKTCRTARTACDRKIKFLFEMTRKDFFPTMDLFLRVYNKKVPNACRSVHKAANKRLRGTLPYCASGRRHLGSNDFATAERKAAGIIKPIFTTSRPYRLPLGLAISFDVAQQGVDMADIYNARDKEGEQTTVDGGNMGNIRNTLSESLADWRGSMEKRQCALEQRQENMERKMEQIMELLNKQHDEEGEQTTVDVDERGNLGNIRNTLSESPAEWRGSMGKRQCALEQRQENLERKMEQIIEPLNKQHSRSN